MTLNYLCFRYGPLEERNVEKQTFYLKNNFKLKLVTGDLQNTTVQFVDPNSEGNANAGLQVTVVYEQICDLKFWVIK